MRGRPFPAPRLAVLTRESSLSYYRHRKDPEGPTRPVGKHAMSHLLVTAGLAALLGGGSAAIGLALGRRRLARTVLDHVVSRLQPSVGLYLRRKVAEEGLEPGEIPSEGDPSAMLSHYTTMAETLLNRERREIETGDTQEIGLARTMRLESTDELVAAGKTGETSGPDEIKATESSP